MTLSAVLPVKLVNMVSKMSAGNSYNLTYLNYNIGRHVFIFMSTHAGASSGFSTIIFIVEAFQLTAHIYIEYLKFYV